MRTHGNIAEVSFKGYGFDVYNLANKYILNDGENTKIIYVNSMSELKSEITEFKREKYHEQHG